MNSPHYEKTRDNFTKNHTQNWVKITPEIFQWFFSSAEVCAFDVYGLAEDGSYYGNGISLYLVKFRNHVRPTLI